MEREIREALQWASFRLEKAGVPYPAAEAEILLSCALESERLSLYAGRPVLAGGKSDCFVEMVSRRCRREPLAYIINRKEFLGRNFYVSPAVLVPRPETELLVEAVATWIRGQGADRLPLCILDLGTGSGVIAVSLALLFPQARVYATDVSPAALEVARKNAHRHGVEKRISFARGDFFDALPRQNLLLFRVVVSNPPYILQDDLSRLPPEVKYEPQQALDGGEDGLFAYRRILSGLPAHLDHPGLLALELGQGQDRDVKALCLDTDIFSAIKVCRDYSGIKRHILCWR